MKRKIKTTVQGHPAVDGAGVKLTRILSYPQIREFDPFLMLDHFGSDESTPGPGFPWHPHRGIVTITYMLFGGIEHEDSMGNRGIVHGGGVQWMKAASGVVHQEMPKPGSNGLGGFQFWLNLPADQKMSAPDYGDIEDGDFQRVLSDGVSVKVIAGEYGGVKGPLDFEQTKPVFLDISFENEANLTIPTHVDLMLFVIGIEGDISVEGEVIHNGAATLLTAGTELHLTAQGPSRLLLVGGFPLNEPIAWEGPIVMNTQDELVQAFQEYRDGSFIQ